MAFVIVSHIFPTASSQLAEILSRHTKMPVMLASTAMPIRANHVYVCPPNADLLIESRTFKVVSPRTGRNKQIDLFLTSLAEAMGARAICIILSGYGGDGTKGCRHIKAKGGTTFAQDMSAEIADMPLHAQSAGCVDFVLPLEKISIELQRLIATASRAESIRSKNTTSNSGKRNQAKGSAPNGDSQLSAGGELPRPLEESTLRTTNPARKKALSSGEFQNIMKPFELEKQKIKRA